MFEKFIYWLLGKDSQTELSEDLGYSSRGFRRHIDWCWQVPVPEVLTGEINPVLILDGIRIAGGVCLIARTREFVVAWTWAETESSVSWSELLLTLPAPKYVVCDGQKGILKALSICWPNTLIQRCQFHVRQNIRTKLTLNPETEAAKELAELMRYLRYAYTAKLAARWVASFYELQNKHRVFLAERTLAVDLKSGGKKWWYTHGRDRSAYRQIRTLIEAGDLFRFTQNSRVPRTTNDLEGGTNSQLKRAAGLHRGMIPEHQKVLVNWWLYYETEGQKPPRFVL